MNIIFNITERKDAEQKLKESEEKFRAIFESIPDLYFLVDEKGTYLEFKGNKELLFLTPDMFLGKNIHETLPKDVAEIYNKAIIKTLETQKPTIIEYSLPINEKMHYYEARNLYFSKSQVAIFVRDITERKEVENLKSEILDRISHELKTPLASIKGFSEMILTLFKEKIDDDVAECAYQINKGCSRLQDLVNNVIESIELPSEKVERKKTSEDLSKIITDCVQELTGLAKLRNNSIKLKIQESSIIELEKNEIHEVISNLLANALKYTPPGGEILIETNVSKDFIIVSFKDTGIGITKEERELLFKRLGKIERFGLGWDVDSEGLGLGLFISKNIIDLHGGKIWVDSEGRNKGSTFYFSLPIISEKI